MPGFSVQPFTLLVVLPASHDTVACPLYSVEMTEQSTKVELPLARGPGSAYCCVVAPNTNVTDCPAVQLAGRHSSVLTVATAFLQDTVIFPVQPASSELHRSVVEVLLYMVLDSVHTMVCVPNVA